MALLAFGLGCAAPTFSIAPGSAAVSSIGLHGKVKGGQQPVYNALIGLYAAGTTGTYGTGSSNLLTTPVYTAIDGTFTITGDYSTSSCTSTTQLYLTATGGDPSGNGTTFNNNAIQLVAALGPCLTGGVSSLNAGTYIYVDEVTTAAAAYALGQFYGGFGTTSDSIGAPSSNIIGLQNAFATAHNLANVSTGYATPTTAATGTNYSLYTVDQQKLNTIANILSDCVNQTTNGSTVCSHLFQYVTPVYAPLTTSTPATPPSNIFQAAVYMSLNPTSTNASGSQISNLIALQTPYQAFAPALSAAPTDWTLAIQYIQYTSGIAYGSSVAVDANGDIWMSNAKTIGGVIMLNGGTGTVGGTAGVTGGLIGFYTGPTAYPNIISNSTRDVAIDLNGKAWFGNFTGTGTTTASGSANYYMFRATGGVGVDGYFNYIAGATNQYSVAVDPSGEILSLASTVLAYISPTATSGANLTQIYTGSGSAGGPGLAIDANHNGYVTATAGSLVPFTGPTPAAVGTAIPVTTTGFSAPYGTAIDGSNQLWVANDPASTFFLTIYNKPGGTFTQITNSCLQKPGFIAFDGNGNAWVTNQNTTGADYTVCEFNSSGTLISNAIGFGQHNVSIGRGVAVDLSGNVWLTSYVQNSNNGIVELVGAAAPAVTPIVYAIKNGKVGTRP
ncbi:MAG: hypothetical protein P4L10_09130 [Acidobacteriaceae bacterium]|nr:hypothetical protein [Acidobacteriaceae bacterium]